MCSLLLDNSHFLRLYLLDDKNIKLDSIIIENSKSSTILHDEILKLLTKSNLTQLEIRNFIFCAGPGSYTGLRIAKGVADIFDLYGVNNLSFYHHEILEAFQCEPMQYYSNAFKGEFFRYSWVEGDRQSRLLNHVEEKNFYSNGTIEGSISFFSFLENNLEEVVELIINKKMKREIFYYRSLEDEFSRNENV